MSLLHLGIKYHVNENSVMLVEVFFSDVCRVKQEFRHSGHYCPDFQL